jgi:hypothetical protein
MDMDGEMNRHMDRYLHRRVDGNVRIYMYVPIDTHICMYKYIYVNLSQNIHVYLPQFI